MQLLTLIKIINLLSAPQGATKQRIAEELEVSDRQVYRYIRDIEELGFPITDEKEPLGRRVYYRLDQSYVKKLPNLHIPSTDLTLPEAIALYLLKGQAGMYKGTLIEKNIVSALGKIGLLLPDKAAEKLGKVKSLFVTAPRSYKCYAGKKEIIRLLTDAMLDSKTCSINYHSFYDDKPKSHLINPLHFFERDGGMYCFAQTVRTKKIITLAVERIQDLKPTDSTFKYPDGFDPSSLLETAFDIVFGEPQDFEIWFSADIARYIKERTWSRLRNSWAEKTSRW